MSKEEVYIKLQEYGRSIDNESFYTELAKKLAYIYYHYFSEERIKQLNYQNMDTMNKTRVPISKDLGLSEKEIEALSFSDFTRLKFLNNTSFVIDLKNQVIEFVYKGKEKHFARIVHLDEFLELLKANYIPDLNVKSIYRYCQSLVVTSYIYQYAYALLEECVTSDWDITRVGMFKNAYFDIMMYVDREQNTKRSV